MVWFGDKVYFLYFLVEWRRWRRRRCCFFCRVCVYFFFFLAPPISIFDLLSSSIILAFSKIVGLTGAPGKCVVLENFIPGYLLSNKGLLNLSSGFMRMGGGRCRWRRGHDRRRSIIGNFKYS